MDSVMMDSLATEIVLRLDHIATGIGEIGGLFFMWLFCRAVAVGIRYWRKCRG